VLSRSQSVPPKHGPRQATTRVRHSTTFMLTVVPHSTRAATRTTDDTGLGHHPRALETQPETHRLHPDHALHLANSARQYDSTSCASTTPHATTMHSAPAAHAAHARDATPSHPLPLTQPSQCSRTSRSRMSTAHEHRPRTTYRPTKPRALECSRDATHLPPTRRAPHATSGGHRTWLDEPPRAHPPDGTLPDGTPPAAPPPEARDELRPSSALARAPPASSPPRRAELVRASLVRASPSGTPRQRLFTPSGTPRQRLFTPSGTPRQRLFTPSGTPRQRLFTRLRASSLTPRRGRARCASCCRRS